MNSALQGTLRCHLPGGRLATGQDRLAGRQSYFESQSRVPLANTVTLTAVAVSGAMTQVSSMSLLAILAAALLAGVKATGECGEGLLFCSGINQCYSQGVYNCIPQRAVNTAVPLAGSLCTRLPTHLVIFVVQPSDQARSCVPRPPASVDKIRATLLNMAARMEV